ncbi:TolC family protein [Novispirillum sp. DQ9]|uniref:TolC family protein n=1 Tax=Novispirillum sp. DQ9 TaxID=3398612 RepID=UPI003C7AEB2E
MDTAVRRGRCAQSRKGRFAAGLLAAASAVALSACAVTPEPLTQQEVSAALQQDLGKMFADQEPITAPVTLHEAMARAIKYNLDHRLKLMEEALAADQLTSANLDMLPDLTASAGYNGRNNFLGSNSRSLLTGQESLVSSTSQDRDVRTADLALTWNVLDFGVSYVRAKQQADRTLIMQERRRKVLQNIIQDVRDAYWNALSADRLLGRVDPLLNRVTLALSQAREIEQRRLQAPVEALTYRRDLLDILRQLTLLRRELAASKTRLAALMNVPVGSKFELAGMDGEERVPDLSLDPAELERLALVHRPEIREEVYQHRISQNDVQRAMLSMLPGIQLSAGGGYTSNSYAYNDTWWNWGSTITGNLIDIVTGPHRIEEAKTQAKVVETRRMALAMAVMSQVHVSWLDYREALTAYTTSDELAEVENELMVQSRNAQRTQSEGELQQIRSELRALVADLRRDLAFAGVRSALGRVFLSVGADPLPDTVDGHDVPTLANALRERADNWLNGRLDFRADAAEPVVPTLDTQPAAQPAAATGDAGPAAVTSDLAAPEQVVALAEPRDTLEEAALAAAPADAPEAGNPLVAALGLVPGLGDLLAPPAARE